MILSMATATTDGRFYIPLLNEFFSDLSLGRSSWRFPVQIGDLIERAQMIFWGAMAFQPPTHAVWVGVVDYFHVIHMTVACHATDASVHMNCMIEINIVGSLVNPNPRDGISGFP